MARIISALLLIFIASTVTAAPKTWIVVGDSIMSEASNGDAQDMATFLIQSEKDVSIRNISSPGAALGAKDFTGYNSDQFVAELARIGGAWSAYHGIIVQAGTNDYGRSIPWADTVEGLRRILSHAKAMNKKVIVLDPIWRAGEDTPNSVGNTLNTYRYFMYLVCVNEYAGTCHFASRMNTIMGTASGASFYKASEVAADTQLHPNVAGHRYLADWIKAEAAAAGYF